MRLPDLIILGLCCTAPGAFGQGPADPAEVLATAAGGSAEAARLLEAGHTGEDVQALQQQVADAIAELAERLAPQGGAPTSIPGEGQEAALARQGTMTAEPDVPGEESVLPPGNWTVGPLAAPPGGRQWRPELPQAQLKELTDAFTEGRLPAHYRERLQAYGRSLASEGESSAEPGDGG